MYNITERPAMVNGQHVRMKYLISDQEEEGAPVSADLASGSSRIASAENAASPAAAHANQYSGALRNMSKTLKREKTPKLEPLIRTMVRDLNLD